jgi:hypothetical protein
MQKAEGSYWLLHFSSLYLEFCMNVCRRPRGTRKRCAVIMVSLLSEVSRIPPSFSSRLFLDKSRVSPLPLLQLRRELWLTPQGHQAFGRIP